ncbi:MAG: phosphate ABC transporter permease subunit PstC [Verrucomicrobiae bacterium]|nr:phosphate ABC transporter permease subunit PstC [Verrucomicrobiae bacterium]
MATKKTSFRGLGAKFLDGAEPLIRILIYASGWSAIIFVAAIFYFIFQEAWPILPRVNWGDFFFTNDWVPVPAEGNEATYGAKSMMYGTFAVTIFSMIIAVPLGLGAAIYISEFATGKVKETFKILIELLAAIPSIVWGFIGLVVLNPIIQSVFGVPVGVNLLNGSIVVAFMAVPLIVSISEDALRAVPDSYREAALALGASKWEIVYRVLFPAAKNGLLAACMLGVGRAVGETMAVLMATGNGMVIPENFANPAILLDKVRTLTATIVSELPDSVHGGDHYRMLFVIGIVLLIFSVVINVTSDIIVKGIKGDQKNA